MSSSELKSEFLYKYGSYYNSDVEALRAAGNECQWPQLVADQTCHLDHAAATVPPRVIIDRICDDWKTNVYYNPHSSRATMELIDAIRERVLQFFSTSSAVYDVIFTSGATAAMKLVGECFNFTEHSSFMYLHESHNSLIGVREFARQNGSQVVSATEQQVTAYLSAKNAINGSINQCNLFAYAPECNATGSKYSLQWIAEARRNQWSVLLDASKFVATNKLDLSYYTPDYVALSFYKIFGMPSGLGALLVRKGKAEAVLSRKVYFSGGTVAASSSSSMFHVLRKGPIHERLEDGTVPFMNIVALRHVFDAMPSFGISDGMSQIMNHTWSLSHFLYEYLLKRRHYNGKPICIVYGKHAADSVAEYGSIVCLNFLRASGEFVGYAEVQKLAYLHNIIIRTGCFCNPGVCESALGLTGEDIRENYEKGGHVCWDDKDLANGKPLGAVRISFGYMSTFADLETFLNLVDKFLVEKQLSVAAAPGSKASLQQCRISHLTVYPIKSCAGMEIESDSSWYLCDTGLSYDREWTIVDAERLQALSMKQVPRLASIRPSIDLTRRVLQLRSEFAQGEVVELDLDHYPEVDTSCAVSATQQLTSGNQVKVCGCATPGLLYSGSKYEELTRWICKVLDRRSLLVRKHPSKHARTSHLDVSSRISFANEAQFLVLARSSLDELNRLLVERGESLNNESSDWLIERFRPNLVLENAGLQEAFAEDCLSTLVLHGSGHCTVRLRYQGPCNRCSMICVDQRTYEKTTEPLRTLMEIRRDKGKILFGVLCGIEEATAVPTSPGDPKFVPDITANSIAEIYMDADAG